MHQSLLNACNSLDELANNILSNFGSDDLIFNSFGNFPFPPVTKQDLASIARDLSEEIKSLNMDKIDSAFEMQVNDIPRRLQIIQSQVAPHLFNGNVAQALPCFIISMDSIKRMFRPYIGWTHNPSDVAPKKLVNRLRSIQQILDNLQPDKDELASQINKIKEATEAADALPTDLQSLRDAQREIRDLSGKAAALVGQIQEAQQSANKNLKDIGDQAVNADKLIERCEQAYRAATTKGLASAFYSRAGSLGKSMMAWVGGLILALGAAAIVGADKFRILIGEIEKPTPNWEGIWILTALSLLSLTAPIWFAWLATKQISQRFRLTEDYWFKATVAMAYEGYRTEATRINPELEARLFSSALTRLEEAPLRLVENADHGSPWHELFSSKEFKNALSTSPELLEKYLQVGKDSVLRAKDLISDIKAPPT